MSFLKAQTKQPVQKKKMAARQPPRGTGLEVQYEDFVPKYEWEDQPEATILTIDLQGCYTE